MNKDHLILRLDTPLMSFGGVVIDNFGETRTIGLVLLYWSA